MREQINLINIPVPDTGWTPPDTFPRLKEAKIVGIDTETYDPNIQELGSGCFRNDGHIVGISVSADGQSWYFPLRHEVEPSMNMDIGNVMRWFKDNVADVDNLKVGANIKYDMGWLSTEGVELSGSFYDVLLAEVIINENQLSYSLDNVAGRYLDMTKDDDLLYMWLYESYGGKRGRYQIRNFYRSPPRLGGAYAERDAELPLLIREKQLKVIQEQDLGDVLDVENRLIPLMHKMRQRGVRVNTDRAERLDNILTQRQQMSIKQFKELSGVEFQDAPTVLVEAFDRCGIAYQKTEKGNPSFPGSFLEHHPEELPKLVHNVRKLEKARGTFVDGYVMKYAYQGRIHAEINQLKMIDEYGERGTIGRFSYNNPNLQNIPSRDPELKREIRGLFLPDDGEIWESLDYSQIEYRALAHFARGKGSDEVRKAFKNDPKTDYHQLTGKLIQSMTGITLERKPTKNINFGFVYGMGQASTIESLGVDAETGNKLFEAYHEGAPFVRETFRLANDRVNKRGYVMTILKRRSRFDLFEPKDRKLQKIINASTDKDKVLENIQEEIEAHPDKKYWRGVQRQGSFRALNRVLQLSAADIIKKAMVNIYESGVCDVLGVPLIQVHDELNFTRPQTQAGEEAIQHVRHIMEVAVKLKVPLLVDRESGENWGELS